MAEPAPPADPLAVSDGPPGPAPTPTDGSVDLTGRTLGDYQILRKLGQGGMGHVYLARQQSLKREVALKLLRGDLNANPTALQRFQAEAEAVARVTHANIVQVYAVGEHDGLRYMALEYVDGRNLREYLARKGPPELPVALLIIRQVAAALQRASELGIVHRDIKPENILLTRKVEVKVTDFGLSRYFAGAADGPPGTGRGASLTQSGVTLGTPLYMSPEQVRGSAVDHRSDIYSFGVTCYHLLAGQPPFRGNTAFEVAIQHIQNEPPPLAGVRPDLPADLCACVHKMMAKDPDARYQTARDIIRDLAKIQRGLAGGAVGSLSGTALGESGTRLGGGSTTQPGLPSVSVPVLVPAGQSQPTLSGFGVTPSGSGPTVIVPVRPTGGRWPARAAGVAVVGTLGFAGWWVAGKASPPPAPTEPAAVVGLPDTRPAAKVVPAKERALLAKWENSATRPHDALAAGLELGLLYVKEHRLDDAERVFKDVELRKIDWTSDLPGAKWGEWAADNPFKKGDTAARLKKLANDHLGDVPGKFGRAIVLAHRDKTAESVKMFETTLGELDGRLLGKNKLLRQTIPELLFVDFLKHQPDFAQAISAAVNRNADNNKGQVPEKLDWLRTPTGLARGPK